MDLNEITRLVAEGQTEEALDALRKDAQIFQEEILLLNTRYENLERGIIQGTISEEVRMLETNRINAAILELIQNYREKQEAVAAAPKGKSGTAKAQRAERTWSLARTILIPLGLLLFVAVAVLMFMSRKEKPVRETGYQRTNAKEKVEVPSGENQQAKSDRSNTNPQSGTNTGSQTRNQAAATHQFYIGKVWSAEGGKIGYEILRAKHSEGKLTLAVKVYNRLGVPLNIEYFALSDYAANGREGGQIRQEKALNITDIKMAAGEAETYQPTFPYKLGDNRKFAFYTAYKIPQKGINSRSSTKINLIDQ